MTAGSAQCHFANATLISCFHFVALAEADLGGGCRGYAPPPEMTRGFLIQLVFCKKKKKTLWFIGVEVEQETSAPPPEKNPGSAPEKPSVCMLVLFCMSEVTPRKVTWNPGDFYLWNPEYWNLEFSSRNRKFRY